MIVHDGEGSLIAALDALGHSNYDPCHRLDAETSGVLICAKKGSTGRIQKCLTAAETIKQYRGIVRGSMKGRGTWTQSLSPKAEGRKNPRGVAATRVAAVTEYTVLEETAYLTAADFVLRSGRTHQIRKHAACNKLRSLAMSDTAIRGTLPTLRSATASAGWHFTQPVLASPSTAQITCLRPRCPPHGMAS